MKLSLSIIATAILAGCSTVDLKPITKPANPRIVERDLVAKPMSKPAASSAVAERPVRRMVPLSEDVSVTADSGKPARVVAASLSGAAVKVGRPAAGAVSGAAPAGTKDSANAAGPVVAAAQKAKEGEAARGVPSTRSRWHVKATDLRLAATFERWAKESGELGRPYTVLWNAARHVEIGAATEYTGTFLEAVEQALKSPSIQHSDYPLEACEYPNTPPVVRVTRWGEQTKECPDFR